MLSKLSISNYALISHVEVEFTEGLSVITGETGSGKSILLGALSLVLGERADLDALRVKTEKCVIEAHLQTAEEHKSFFEKHDLDFEQETIVRRELSPSGKSRAFINDTPVNLKTLKLFGDQMVDVHSQMGTGQLRDTSFQFELLDAAAKQQTEVIAWKTRFALWRNKLEELEELKAAAAQSKRDLDYFRFQFEELQELNLDQLNQEALESEAAMHRNAEDIAHSFGKVVFGLEEAESSILEELKRVSDALDGTSRVHGESAQLQERLKSSLIELKDIAEEATSLRDKAEGNPERLAQIEGVLDGLYALQNKHQLTSAEELIALRDELDAKINSIDSVEDRIIDLERWIEQEETGLLKQAQTLHKGREKAGVTLQKEIQAHLKAMKMPDAIISFHMTPSTTLDKNGCADLELLFSANKGSAALPLEKVASGGELSRLMLALKAAVSAYKKLPTLILDEIDTGVSGDVAARMADVMKHMSEELQLIAISHLPQVAGKAKQHYKVLKSTAQGTTQTSIVQLDTAARLEELASMLSGEQVTDSAREHAKALMN
ncbi:MAG: DNA repair protein RecN [Flavobacteriales bacterium]|nr:DNA repair protein RecN [Flavobacteriales bacterium]